MKRLSFSGVAIALAMLVAPVVHADENPYTYKNLPEKDDQIKMVVAHTVNMEWS